MRPCWRTTSGQAAAAPTARTRAGGTPRWPASARAARRGRTARRRAGSSPTGSSRPCAPAAARTTTEGARVTLPARPDLAVAEPPAGTARDTAQQVECPSDLGCDYTPAAYALTDPNDPTSYGNYNPANRPTDGEAIRYIVIHDTESDYAGAIASFQNPREQATAHYLVRSSDGHVTQLVHTKDIAWHA